MEKEFLRMKLADLVPYENNPRHNEEAVDATIASMQQCGNIDPIEVDEDNVILSGHTRRLALMKMGYEESDVVRVTGLTDLQKKKYRILANKTNELQGGTSENWRRNWTGSTLKGSTSGFILALMWTLTTCLQMLLRKNRKNRSRYNVRFVVNGSLRENVPCVPA